MSGSSEHCVAPFNPIAKLTGSGHEPDDVVVVFSSERAGASQTKYRRPSDRQARGIRTQFLWSTLVMPRVLFAAQQMNDVEGTRHKQMRAGSASHAVT